MQNDDQHNPFIENIPAYALGSLDAEEAAALEAHLMTCASCRDELAACRLVSENLLMALPPRAPRAVLRQRLKRHLPSAQKADRPRWTWSFNQFALGIALVVLLALNVFSLVQMQSFQHQQAQLTREMQTGQIALAMLAYPGTQSLPINAANIAGTLLLDKDRNVAVLIVWNLPALQNNQTYQAWFIDRQGERTSAAIFDTEPTLPFTSVSIISPSDLSSFTGLGVTVEPAGGSKQPTGPRLFKIDF
jgi:anti-sigma-K factor RskA